MTSTRLLVAWLASAVTLSAAPVEVRRPIVLQGALQMETARLVSQLKDARHEVAGPWTFWRGTIDGYPVVVSRTRMGAANAAAATTAAIERFRPIAIINQGTAGGHDPALRVGDIVLGVSAVSIAGFKTKAAAAGEGSHALSWTPFDVVERPKDEDGALHENDVAAFPADSALLEAGRAAAKLSSRARVSEGVIGSSEVWNEEADRIAFLRRTFGTSVEEMETASAAQVARLYGIPFLGIRVVTANVTNGGAYDPKTAEACQDFALSVVRVRAERLKKPD
jgi:adenosylhomocysteine nucleosidase